MTALRMARLAAAALRSFGYTVAEVAADGTTIIETGGRLFRVAVAEISPTAGRDAARSAVL